MGTPITEGRHRAEFIASEAAGWRSRDTGTVLMHATAYKAGEVVVRSGGKYSRFAAAVSTLGETVEPGEIGILYDNIDASAADVPGCVLIVRDAEVNLSELTYPAETTNGDEEQHVIDALARVGIIARPGERTDPPT